MKAQLTTADIVGTVYDSSGAVLPNATVTVTKEGTHEARSTLSGNDGQYSFTSLLPGSYSVKVKAQGFTTLYPLWLCRLGDIPENRIRQVFDLSHDALSARMLTGS
jgi:carboxypeptidase family protein